MLLLFILLSRSWVKLSILLSCLLFPHYFLSFLYILVLLIFHFTYLHFIHLSFTVTPSPNRKKGERIQLIWKKHRIFVTNIYHFFNLNETKTYFESQARLLFLRHTWHKKSLSPKRFWSPIPKRKHIFCNDENLCKWLMMIVYVNL